METELILYYDGGVYPLDLTGVVSCPISGSVADIREPQKKSTSFSKTLVLPGTAKNNRALKFIFEISGVDGFNPNKKVRCALYNDGVKLPLKFFRLEKIRRVNNGTNNYNSVEYDCNLFGDLSDFIKSLGDDYLQDLDFSSLNHTYNRTNVVSSWTNIGTYGSSLTISSMSDDSGCVEITTSTSHGLSALNMVYIEYTGALNYKYNGHYLVKAINSATSFTIYHTTGIVETASGTVKRFTPSGTSIYYPMIDYGLNFGTQWDLLDFTPAIPAYLYLQKIFQNIGWLWDSNFLETDFFKMLYIPFNGTSIVLDQADLQAKLFRASLSSDQSITTLSLGSGPIYGGVITNTLLELDDDSTAPNFDNSGTFNTTLFKYTAPSAGKVSFKGQINFNISLDADPIGAGYPQTVGNNYVKILVYKNGSLYTGGGYGGLIDMTSDSIDGTIYIQTFDILLQAGDEISFYIQAQFYQLKWYSGSFTNTYSGALNADITIKQDSYIMSVINDVSVIEGSTMPINNCIPDKIKQADFFVWICKLFNLYVDGTPDKDKLLRIEPRDDYYSNNETIDITHLLDTDQEIVVIPMGELNMKSIRLSYKEDKDVFNVDHQSVYGKIYGEKRVEIDNDFMTAEQLIQPGFSPTVLADYPVGTDRVISTIVGNGVITQNRIASNIRILFVGVKGTKDTWQFHDSAGDHDYNIYPYAGHLDNVALPYYDLNFDFPGGVYYNYDGWTDNNLGNRFYKKSIEEIIDPNAKLVQAHFKLRSAFINTLDFRNYLRVDTHTFRLNRYQDFDAIVPSTTMLELIKVKNINRFVPNPKPGVLPADPDTYTSPTPKGSGNSGKPTRDVPAINDTNYKRGNNSGIQIQGKGNIIGYGTKNCIIIGNDNVIADGLENVVILGLDGQTVDKSDTFLGGSYEEYRVTMTQTSANDPVVYVINNNTGSDITWVRDSKGVYKGTFDNSSVTFPEGRTLFIPPNVDSGTCSIFWTNDGVTLQTHALDGAVADNKLNDSTVVIMIYRNA